jgi:AraC-like DNA-binding protein
MGMLTSMLERLDQRLNARDIADEFGYSERSLIRTFQHELGMSYGQFKKIARIIKAVELLSLGSPRISDVMFAVGYESPSTFTQNFKKLLGMTPSAYLATQR